MTWANPTSPNLPDFLLFVENNMQVPASAMPAATVQPPAAPGLTAGSSGALPSETVFVKLTYVSAFGETVASPESSVPVTGPNGSVTVASPPATAQATGFNVYAANATGQETLQNPAPIAIGTPFSLAGLSASAVVPPLVNTTGWNWASYAFNRAKNLVFNIPGVAGLDYVLAVYNCAGHMLLALAPDQTGQTFFQTARTDFKLLEPSSGVISASSDQGTSNSIEVPESLRNLTIGDLFFFRTPWGREYLAYAQDFGQIGGLT